MRTLLLDGALGTELALRGASLGFVLTPPSFAIAANDQHPQLVQALHRAYLDAGAKLLTLNSFGLSQGLSGRDLAAIRERAQTALSLARNAGGDVALEGSLSLAPALLDLDPTSRLLLEVEALAQVGVTQLRIETLRPTPELGTCLAKLLETVSAFDLKIQLNFFQQVPENTLKMLHTMGWFDADTPLGGLGLNCMSLEQIPSAADRLVEDLHPWIFGAHSQLRELTLSLRPHASQSHEGHWHTHAVAPEKLAHWSLRQSKTLAARWPGTLALGGCCGCGPEHTQAMARALAGQPA